MRQIDRRTVEAGSELSIRCLMVSGFRSWASGGLKRSQERVGVSGVDVQARGGVLRTLGEHGDEVRLRNGEVVGLIIRSKARGWCRLRRLGSEEGRFAEA